MEDNMFKSVISRRFDLVVLLFQIIALSAK